MREHIIFTIFTLEAIHSLIYNMSRRVIQFLAGLFYKTPHNVAREHPLTLWSIISRYAVLIVNSALYYVTDLFGRQIKLAFITGLLTIPLLIFIILLFSIV